LKRPLILLAVAALAMVVGSIASSQTAFADDPKVVKAKVEISPGLPGPGPDKIKTDVHDGKVDKPDAKPAAAISGKPEKVTSILSPAKGPDLSVKEDVKARGKEGSNIRSDIDIDIHAVSRPLTGGQASHLNERVVLRVNGKENVDAAQLSAILSQLNVASGGALAPFLAAALNSNPAALSALPPNENLKIKFTLNIKGNLNEVSPLLAGLLGSQPLNLGQVLALGPTLTTVDLNLPGLQGRAGPATVSVDFDLKSRDGSLRESIRESLRTGLAGRATQAAAFPLATMFSERFNLRLGGGQSGSLAEQVSIRWQP
jgi:hypothetical protein